MQHPHVGTARDPGITAAGPGDFLPWTARPATLSSQGVPFLDHRGSQTDFVKDCCALASPFLPAGPRASALHRHAVLPLTLWGGYYSRTHVSVGETGTDGFSSCQLAEPPAEPELSPVPARS